MALFDDNASTSLQDVLGKQAENQGMDIQNAYAKFRSKAVSQQAHSGRLGSGVANYPLADIDSGEISALGDVQGNLASSLGQIPANDFLVTQEDNRQRQLAALIASLEDNGSWFSDVFGGAGRGAQAGGSTGGPWGALGGAFAGGISGAATTKH